MNGLQPRKRPKIAIPLKNLNCTYCKLSKTVCKDTIRFYPATSKPCREEEFYCFKIWEYYDENLRNIH